MQFHHTSHRIREGRRGAGPAAFVPRRERSRRLSDAAMARGRAEGRSIIECCDRMIAAVSGTFVRTNLLKIKIENLIARGPAAARGLFGGIAAEIPAGADLDEAIALIEGWRRTELAQIAMIEPQALGGRNHKHRQITADLLRTAIVALRLMRMRGEDHHFGRMLEILQTPLWQATAVSDDGAYVEFAPNDIPEWPL